MRNLSLTLKTVALIFFLAASAFAESVLLIWDANPVSDDVQGYYVWQASNVTGPFIVTTNSVTNGVRVQVLQAGRYFWYVTASNFWGMSSPSNTANTPTLASNVMTLRLQR